MYFNMIAFKTSYWKNIDDLSKGSIKFDTKLSINVIEDKQNYKKLKVICSHYLHPE